MATGFYTAASGMLMQQRALNVSGNNLANTKTPGFKTQRVVSNVFGWELLNRIENGDNLIGKGAPVRLVHDVPTDYDSPSSLEQTERPFDMAINGIGFFNILVPGQEDAEGKAGEDKIYLTRNGNFDIDEEGYLILRGFGRVQGQNGDIHVDGSNFRVDPDGIIYDEEDNEIDTFKISEADDNTLLTVARNGLYLADPDPKSTPETVAGEIAYDTGETAGVHDVDKPNIRQGWLESSNVDLNREFTQLMAIQRNYQACRQAMRMIDNIDAKTVTICRAGT